MRRSIFLAAFAVVLAAGSWHLAAIAQDGLGTPQSPASPAAAAPPAGRPAAAAAAITFDEYRDFRTHYIAARQAGLARALAARLAPDEKARLGRIKAYYDRLAAMPAAERDRLFRARFDQIDTDHDGKLDDAERAAWRAKQRQHYSELAAERAAAQADRAR
jgi:hypothetical protein